MKKRPVDRERTVRAHYQATKIPEPSEGTLDRPSPFVAPEDTTVLRRRPITVRAVGSDQQNSPLTQSAAQCVAVIALIGNHPQRFLPGTPRMMPPPYADRCERLLREPHFRRGRRGKGVPQRKTAVSDH